MTAVGIYLVLVGNVKSFPCTVRLIRGPVGRVYLIRSGVRTASTHVCRHLPPGDAPSAAVGWMASYIRRRSQRRGATELVVYVIRRSHMMVYAVSKLHSLMCAHRRACSYVKLASKMTLVTLLRGRRYGHEVN